MDGNALTAEDIGAIARLPSRDVLYAQLVDIVAYPISGLARTLNQLIGGLAVALGQIQEQGLVGGDAPAEEAAPARRGQAPRRRRRPPGEDAGGRGPPRSRGARGRRTRAEPAATEPPARPGRGRRHARRDFVTT